MLDGAKLFANPKFDTMATQDNIRGTDVLALLHPEENQSPSPAVTINDDTADD
jgi:hypothetical protein